NIPKNAEVISSIGVALSMVRDVVERIIPSPTKDDIRSIKKEAMNKAVESGASPDSVEIHIEIDSQTSKVTAIATGSTEVKTTDLLQKCSEEEARELAAADLRLSRNEVRLLEKTEHFFVFGGKAEQAGQAVPIRIVDSKGFIKVQRGYAMAVKAKVKDYQREVKRLWEDMAVYQSEMIARPDYYLCIGPRVMDFSATEFNQISLLMEIETSAMDPEDDVIVVAANMKQT
ncbi:MAG: hydantoinase/oxoprolinase family protein, partial [Oscillospiraceae bacterium]|nr:hydantoinase/oxoprolinase family protein [Oscillospiraceae bacterium]